MTTTVEVNPSLDVLVVEDENFQRLVLSDSLAANGLNVVAGAANAQSAMKLFYLHRPDVVTLDIDLGEGPTGIDIAYAMREKDPKVAIVVLTVIPDPRLLRPNLRTVPPNVVYLEKSHIGAQEAILNGIQEAIEMSHNPGSKKSLPSNEYQKKIPLTDTQIELMRLIALGLSNAEISKRRFTTVKSTENSISRLAKILRFEHDETTNQRVQIARTYFNLLRGR
ncbi:MAG: response regulator [Actinobacteria bacterium]|uniref:Unannotated protein n=1 Tax=freshwater metagenome TaxID=449393 RepID=A0A6J7V341_9ZZZZ|nr:response regulator [Actinomycetota bacterium]